MTLRNILLLLLAVATMPTEAQQFYHLYKEDVFADTTSLSAFRHSSPLAAEWRDSLYTVDIVYPEFADLSKAEAQLFAKLYGGGTPGEMPEVKTAVTFDRKRPSLTTEFCPVVCRGGRYQMITSFMLRTTAKLRPVAMAQAPGLVPPVSDGSDTIAPAKRYAEHSVLANGTWAKIRVPSTGVYQLSDALIRQAGFANPSKVKIYGYGGNLINETLLASDLVAHDDLKEVPTCDVNGKRLFYALGPVSWSSKSAARRTRNCYSDYGYYFLTESDDSPAKVDSAAFVDSFYPSPYYYHDIYEKDGYAYYGGGRNLYDARQVSAGSSYSVDLAANPNATSAQLSVNATSVGTCRVQVEFNDSIVGTLSMSISDSQNQYGCEQSATYTVRNLAAGKNTVKFTVAAGMNAMRLDYASIAYNYPLPAPDLKAAQIAVPEYVYRITNQDHHADPQADMVIIIPTSQKLLAEAQRLKELHERVDTMRVNIVPADELYNEFSSGTPDASAYRRYLKMLYDRAATAADMPKYLLLFGNGVWDNRLLTDASRSRSADDLLLTYESEGSLSKLNSYVDDGFFCMLDDGEGSSPLVNDKVDVSVGRYPVTTPDEAKIINDKVVAYVDNANSGAWQNTIMFMGDDGDSNLHMKDANQVADEVTAAHPGFLVKKVMWDTYLRETAASGHTYPAVTKIIKQQQQDGALIMDYAGHGSEIQMSHEKVLRINDFEAFTNKNMPLWVTASCDIMPFDHGESTIGETAMLNAKGGAVAFYGTTRTVYASANTYLNSAFMRYVLTYEDNGRPITIGEAQRLAKNYGNTNQYYSLESFAGNSLKYSLLGDPAMRLNLPVAELQIDSIGGVDVRDGDKLATMSAGEIVTVKGHVVGHDDYNGLVTLNVRDSKESIVTRGNTEGEKDYDGPFTYTDRTKYIFTGTNNVTDGKFEFTFAVPKDINYSDETGIINMSAINTEHNIVANGYCERFTVGGSQLADNDSIGPSIYCYLNSPSFSNGDCVNATPYFVAEITDKDGINASGSGIGHDMQLIIDGKQLLTYSLNDNFTFDFGSYTQGSTYYNIPELEEGKHKLQFRAWDILNNVSIAELDFEVRRGVKPAISVSCTKNPARESTTFVVAHDRVDSEVSVIIDVFDMSGRQLWRHEETGVSTGANYTVDWDLSVDGGMKLQTGVYLYRVHLTSDGGTTMSKAKKLVVIGNN